MAYLKGGSVVDGNLYVEGGLVVRNITTSSGAGGQIPTIDDDCAKGSYIVKFDNDQGAIKYTTLKESLNDNTSTIINDKAIFTLKIDGLTNNGCEVLTTKFENKEVFLTINSTPLNISVNTPKALKVKIKEVENIIDTDFFIDSITSETPIEDIPTEFYY